MSGKEVLQAKERSLERLRVLVVTEMLELESLVAQSDLSSEDSPRQLAIGLLEENEEVIRKFEGVQV